MTREKKKSIAQADILELPGISWIRRRIFLTRIRGNQGNAVRALLFLDLAEAVRLNIPLDQALRLIAQDKEEKFSISPLPNFMDREYMVKRLADYLLPWVRQGLSLSQAMSRLGGAFSRQETLIVQLGEKSGRLPQALKRLGDYRQTDMMLYTLKNYLVYPTLLAVFASGIISFILIVIVPKLQAIYDELGAELPRLTINLIQVSDILIHHTFSVVLAVVLVFLILRLFGSAIRWGTGEPILAYVPLVGGLYRSVREARWLAALSLGLEGGMSADQALMQAGAISGDGLEKRSRAATRLVSQGLSIGEACIQCNVLESWMNHRLQLIDWRGDFIQGLRAIVEDTDERIVRTVEGFSQRLEVVGIITMGVFVGFTVIAIYLPIFYIPRVMLGNM
jgi:general secretion pathway protein F